MKRLIVFTFLLCTFTAQAGGVHFRQRSVVQVNVNTPSANVRINRFPVQRASRIANYGHVNRTVIFRSFDTGYVSRSVFRGITGYAGAQASYMFVDPAPLAAPVGDCASSGSSGGSVTYAPMNAPASGTGCSCGSAAGGTTYAPLNGTSGTSGSVTYGTMNAPASVSRTIVQRQINYVPLPSRSIQRQVFFDPGFVYREYNRQVARFPVARATARIVTFPFRVAGRVLFPRHFR